MDFLGYLLVLGLFGREKYVFNKNDKLSFEVKPVGELAQSIFETENGEPRLIIENIRKGGLIDKEEKVKYYSNNLRNFILFNNVSSEEDGFVITLTKRKNINTDLHAINTDKKIPEAVFIPNNEDELSCDSKDELDSVIYEYAESVKKKVYENEMDIIKKHEIENKNYATSKKQTENFHDSKKTNKVNIMEKIKNAIKFSKDLKEKLSRRKEIFNRDGDQMRTTLTDDLIHSINYGQIFEDKQTGFDISSRQESSNEKFIPDKEIEHKLDDTLIYRIDDSDLDSDIEAPPIQLQFRYNHGNNDANLKLLETHAGSDFENEPESVFSSCDDDLQSDNINQENHSEEEEEDRERFYSSDFKIPSFNIADEEELDDFIPEENTESSDEDEYQWVE